MNRRAVLSLAFAVVLMLGVAGVALGQGSPETAQRLVGDTPIGGAITGSNAGSFDYYVIDYPGDERVVRIEVRFAPGDPAVLAGVGFNVYGPAGFDIGESMPTGNNDGVEDLSYSESNDTRWLVQVYNYIQGLTVSYTITAEGLPAPAATPTPQPTPVGTLAPTPTPAAPAGGVMRLDTSVSGSLVGSSGGAFDRYEIAYPGDNSEVTLTMTYAPDNSVISPGVGFIIYGPEGQEFVAQTTGTPGERRVTLASDVAGTYLVQVHNYIEGLVVGYTIGR